MKPHFALLWALLLLTAHQTRDGYLDCSLF